MTQARFPRGAGWSKFSGLDSDPKDYEEVRGEIRTGDLFFASGRYFLSRLISRASWSEFSHVGLIYRINDRVLVCEAVEGAGVRLIPLSRYLTDYEADGSGRPYDGNLYLARIRPELGGTQAGKMFEHVADRFANPFKWTQFLKMTGRLIGGRGRDPRDGQMVCSEFVRDCFEADGVGAAQLALHLPRRQLRLLRWRLEERTKPVRDAERRNYVFPDDIAALDAVVPWCRVVRRS